MDAARRLTDRGREQSRAAGIALMRMRTSFDLVLFSSRARARETAKIALEQWDEQRRPDVQAHRPLGKDFDGRLALEAVSPLPANAHVLMVGHEPDFSTVIAQLTGARVDLKKGGLAVVRLKGGAVRLDGVAGELILLMRPRELALIAGKPGTAPNRRVLAKAAPVRG